MKCDIPSCPNDAEAELVLGDEVASVLCMAHLLDWKAHIEAKRPGVKVNLSLDGETIH